MRPHKRLRWSTPQGQDPGEGLAGALPSLTTSFFADIQHPIIAQRHDVGLGRASCNFQVDVFANRDAIRAAINMCFIKNKKCWSGVKQVADFRSSVPI